MILRYWLKKKNVFVDRTRRGRVWKLLHSDTQAHGSDASSVQLRASVTQAGAAGVGRFPRVHPVPEQPHENGVWNLSTSVSPNTLLLHFHGLCFLRTRWCHKYMFLIVFVIAIKISRGFFLYKETSTITFSPFYNIISVTLGTSKWLPCTSSTICPPVKAKTCYKTCWTQKDPENAETGNKTPPRSAAMPTPGARWCHRLMTDVWFNDQHREWKSQLHSFQLFLKNESRDNVC